MVPFASSSVYIGLALCRGADATEDYRLWLEAKHHAGIGSER